MEFSRQEYWSRLPVPTPGDLSDPRIEPASLASPALAGGLFTTGPPGKPECLNRCIRNPYCVHTNISPREPLILVAFKTEKVDPVSMRALIVSPCIFTSTYPRVLEKRRRKITSVPQKQPYLCLAWNSS